MQKVNLNVSVAVYADETELPPAEQSLLESARQATYRSYAPYSHFHVGAAVLLEDGTVITANNQENAAFPSGSCAEQSAIYWVGANYPDEPIAAIAVVARPGTGSVFKPVAPCGACRQSLLEYEHRQGRPIRLLMLGPGREVVVSESIANLLPVKFGAGDLVD
jgi:cytidine deaminase